METAKVDIRKLQLLNDRINQCIDALTQVRLSVHGLSASIGQQGFGGFPVQGLSGFQGQQIPGYLGQQPPFVPFQPGFGGISPFASQPFVPPIAASGFGAGLSHTAGAGLGFGAPQGNPIPWLSPQAQGANPLPWLSPVFGLSHTSPEEYTRSPFSDPVMASRIGLTFPYAHYLYPPSVSMY
jgi:hypothetical protein